MTKLERLQRIGVGLILSLSIVTSSTSAVLASHATGPNCAGLPFTFTSGGRCYEDGFFTGEYKTPVVGVFIWPDGLDVTASTTDGTPASTSAATFITRVQTRLNVDLTGCDLNPVFLTAGDPCILRKKHAIGAAFIIHAMLGNPGTNFTDVADGIAQAKAQFGAWAARINLYESTGDVLWNEIVTTPAGEPDWYGDASGRDVYWSVFSQDPEPTVVFTNPDGSTFLILRKCANPKGTLPPLEPPPPPPPPPPSGEWIYEPETTSSSGLSAKAGDPVSINGFTTNIGDASGPAYEQTIQVSQGSASRTGGDPLTVNFAAGLAPGGTTNPFQTVTFTIGFGTPVGDEVCFTTTTSPAAGTNTGGVIAVTDDEATSAEVCVTIVDSPYLKVYGNDIWSGGAYDIDGTCTVPPASPPTNFGSIRSYIDGSVGAAAQFAAFAWGNIEAFGTAEITDGTALAFANTNVPNPGNFGAERCLSGLFDDDTSGHPTSGQIDDLLWDSSDGDIALPTLVTWAPVGTDAQLTRSGDLILDIAATPPVCPASPLLLSDRRTLLVSGDVTITENLVNSPCYGTVTNPDIPILVVIAAGNISIAPGVTRLDGIFIAQGTIDTCNGTTPLTIDVCDEPLEINGSFIANRIAFRRTAGSLTGAATSSGAYTSRCDYDPSPTSLFALPASLDMRCAAEIFRFSPEIYLAQPIFRRGTSSELPIRQLRELPPLF